MLLPAGLADARNASGVYPLIPERDRAPLLFRVAKHMMRERIRGAHRLCNLATRLRMLDGVVRYHLPRNIDFRVPVWHVDYRWDDQDLRRYERAVIDSMSGLLGGTSDVTLVDCGADIGLFSALLCACAPAIKHVLAFEPNPAVRDILRSNLAALPAEAQVYSQALGNVAATGALVSPDYDPTPHGRFVEPGKGDVSITTLDSFTLGKRIIALKIDVEGGELEVLQGARQTIAGAAQIVISFEAHPDVIRRTGRSPAVCIDFLNGIRPFRYLVAESGAAPADTDWKANRNIIATTL